MAISNILLAVPITIAGINRNGARKFRQDKLEIVAHDLKLPLVSSSTTPALPLIQAHLSGPQLRHSIVNLSKPYTFRLDYSMARHNPRSFRPPRERLLLFRWLLVPDQFCTNQSDRIRVTRRRTCK